MKVIGRRFLTKIVILFSSVLLILFFYNTLFLPCKTRIAHSQKCRPNPSDWQPTIFFVTPSAQRLERKADLTRLGQTLANVPNLVWLIVEDSSVPSPFIGQLTARLGIRAVHLTAKTPAKWLLKSTDPHWKYPKGVVQRNAALRWLRENATSHRVGAVYFGDDDNTYDWRLFDEIRSLRRVGVWPVGIVGGLLAEFAHINTNGVVTGFNAKWKPSRPFPIDMAAFAVNISLIHDHAGAEFSYKFPRGFLESHFLRALNVTLFDLEPLAQNGTKVYVWHTRTAQTQLDTNEMAKFHGTVGETDAEKDAIS